MMNTRNLCRYFGGVRAIHDLDIEVWEGLIQSVIGPNGAGKTTLFNVISGILPPTSGTIFYKGNPTSGMDSHRIAGLGVTRTFQNLQLFSEMTVLENVMVGMHLRSKGGLVASALKLPWVWKEEGRIRDVSMEILQFTGLEKYAPLVAGSLPFGRQRILEIARALGAGPRLLMLDEPAAGLNNRETSDLSDLIGRIRKRGITILLVEHDMNLVMEISDHVTVLDQGQKIAEGDPEAVRNDEKVLKAYLGQE
ncbi:MAG: ABC transporter ATP-binding protein [bacterium]|nr:ABC transporter ATP-binding protein [bacterium]